MALLSVNYGQRHARELQAAAETAAALGAPHCIADLRPVSHLFGGSALTSDAIDVPDGHYADETMKMTVVPNRNALLLDLAVALAVTTSANAVAYGAHAGDHPVYPDCRPEFVAAYQRWPLPPTTASCPAGSP